MEKLKTLRIQKMSLLKTYLLKPREGEFGTCLSTNGPLTPQGATGWTEGNGDSEDVASWNHATLPDPALGTREANTPVPTKTNAFRDQPSPRWPAEAEEGGEGGSPAATPPRTWSRDPRANRRLQAPPQGRGY